MRICITHCNPLRNIGESFHFLIFSFFYTLCIGLQVIFFSMLQIRNDFVTDPDPAPKFPISGFSSGSFIFFKSKFEFVKTKSNLQKLRGLIPPQIVSSCVFLIYSKAPEGLKTTTLWYVFYCKVLCLPDLEHLDTDPDPGKSSGSGSATLLFLLPFLITDAK